MGEFRAYVLRVMALANLPASMIENEFNRMESNEFRGLNMLERAELSIFNNYFRKQWLCRVGPVKISVFGVPDRTNNVVESLHRWCKSR